MASRFSCGWTVGGPRVTFSRRLLEAPRYSYVGLWRPPRIRMVGL